MLKIRDITDSEKAISALMGTKLPVNIGFRLSLFLKNIEPSMKTFNEQRMNIFKEHGDVDDKTQIYTIRKDEVEIANEKLTNLLDEEVHVSPIPKFKVEDFKDVEIEPSILYNIHFMLIPEEEQTTKE
jgi:hypothetical protein